MTEGLRIIGASLGRTGTQSTAIALEQLGLRCYGMRQIVPVGSHLAAWSEAALEGKEQDWPALLAGYQATIGWPMCFFVDRFAHAFPEAKFLLSERDAEGWAKSLLKSWTALSVMRKFRFIPRVGRVIALVESIMGRVGGVPPTHERAVVAFEAHVDWVREVVPAQRLVEFDIREGWAPLCSALQLPVPDRPFPRANAGDASLKKFASALISGKKLDESLGVDAD